MKSYVVHLKNKYPEAQIQGSESGVQAWEGGELIVALAKNGAGQWQDVGEELGARDAWSLDPIPVEARAWKLCPKGCIRKHEKHDERKAWAKDAAKKYGKIHGIEEFKKIEKIEEPSSPSVSE